VRIEELVQAEPGWKAMFREPDGGESQSRVLGWAVARGDENDELVGVIVDPTDPSRIVVASEAVSPEGGSFDRYRFVAPKPPPPPAPSPEEPSTTEQVAKSILKRRR